MADEIYYNVVDSNTGEIVTTIEEGDSIKRKKDKEKVKKYLEEYETNFNKGVSFVKLYDEVLDKLAEVLTNTEFTVAIRLARHVSYGDCILRYNGNPNGKILTIDDLSELLNLNYKTCNRIINALVKKGVLGIHKTGNSNGTEITKVITCNPFIYSRGKKIEKDIINYFFERSGWVFENGGE